MKQKELVRISLKTKMTSFWDSENSTFILVKNDGEVICRGPEMMKQVNGIMEEMSVSEEVAVEMLYQFLSRCISCTNTIKLTSDSKGSIYLSQVGNEDVVKIKRKGRNYTVFEKTFESMKRYQFDFVREEQDIVLYEIKVELEEEKITFTPNTITVDSARAQPDLMQITFKGRKNEEKEIRLLLDVIRFFIFWKSDSIEPKKVAIIMKERIREIIQKNGYRI